MDKIYYKELIEKYFDGNITDAKIKELSDWIKIFQIGCRH